MNEVSNKLEIELSNGEKIQFQTINVPDPPLRAGNPSQVTQDYYIIFHKEKPKLIHVAVRSPLKIEQLDLASAKGQEFWRQVDGYLKNKE